MRHVEWMESDERSPEQVRRDRLNNLRHEEKLLLTRLQEIKEEKAALSAGHSGQGGEK